jgi:chorismate mutase
MKLEESRRKIDAIDTEILILLNRRAEVSKEIGVLKFTAGMPITDTQREDDIIRRIGRENDGAMRDNAVVGIYRAILQESRRIQTEVCSEISSEGAI